MFYFTNSFFKSLTGWDVGAERNLQWQAAHYLKKHDSNSVNPFISQRNLEQYSRKKKNFKTCAAGQQTFVFYFAHFKINKGADSSLQEEALGNQWRHASRQKPSLCSDVYLCPAYAWFHLKGRFMHSSGIKPPPVLQYQTHHWLLYKILCSKILSVKLLLVKLKTKK